MIQFRSKREKLLWIGVVLAIIGIFVVLVIGQPLAGMLRDRQLLTNGFWIAIYLVLGTIIWHGWKRRISRLEIGVWIGIIAIYLLALLRMAVPEERSHLIEYSVLAIFIHEALKERNRHGKPLKNTGLVAFGMASAIGLLDECSQLFIPNRVFDPIDIGFNTGAALMAILASKAISWSRKKISKLRK